MSCDMDLLIASFNSTAHISQEAIDLAALQAQLSSSLFAGARPTASFGQCPTTPTMSSMELTPSPPNQSPAQLWPASSSSGSHQQQSQYQQYQTEEDEEDMQMIEESLLFGGPSTHSYSQSTNEANATTASYAAIDPFFAAQLKASQAPPTSYFAPPTAFGFSSSTSSRPSPFARRY